MCGTGLGVPVVPLVMQMSATVSGGTQKFTHSFDVAMAQNPPFMRVLATDAALSLRVTAVDSAGAPQSVTHASALTVYYSEIV